MPIESVHPLYSTFNAKWHLGCDSYDGEEAIKKGGKKYLPATSGQIEDGADVDSTSVGAKCYDAYNMRAIYPDLYREAVEAAIGIMHREPPNILLPKSMEGLLENSTLLGESLVALLRKINARQLITGRVGLLGDIAVDADGKSEAVIAIYNELAILNWQEESEGAGGAGLVKVILDESRYEMGDDLNWEYKNKYRLLALTQEGKPANSGEYGSIVLDKGTEVGEVEIVPHSLLGNVLGEIPFVFVNSKDISSCPDTPPLDGLARLCLGIYRGEADYRQNLFMQGQDTLVLIGSLKDETDTVRTGAGSRIDVSLAGDAKYIGVDSQGLPEQRQALENDYKRAVQKSGTLTDATSRAKESGDALRIRVAAQTATLPQIAKTGAAALEKVLRIIAGWYGADPEECVVTPNLTYTEGGSDSTSLVQLMQAKGLGAPISEESIHEWLSSEGFSKLKYEEELARIANEEPLLGMGVPPLGEEGE